MCGDVMNKYVTGFETQHITSHTALYLLTIFCRNVNYLVKTLLLRDCQGLVLKCVPYHVYGELATNPCTRPLATTYHVNPHSPRILKIILWHI